MELLNSAHEVTTKRICRGQVAEHLSAQIYRPEIVEQSKDTAVSAVSWGSLDE